VGINARLDALPGPMTWVGGRSVAAFRVAGVTGFWIALLVVTGGAVLSGHSPVVGLGLVVACTAGSVLWASLRRLATGREDLVQLEYVWLCPAVATGLLVVLGEPLAPWLDLVAIGLVCFLAAGRVGCLLAGCCHGHPSEVGTLVDDPAPARGWPAVRVFPVPLLEAGCLAAVVPLAVVALSLARSGAVALALGLVTAVLRLATDPLRGDRGRARLRRSGSYWMAGTQLFAVLVLADRWATGGLRPVAVAAAGILFAAWLVVSAVRGEPTGVVSLVLVRETRAAAAAGRPVDVAGLGDEALGRLARLAFGAPRPASADRRDYFRTQTGATP